jgi:hypothetical protein
MRRLSIFAPYTLTLLMAIQLSAQEKRQERVIGEVTEIVGEENKR